MITKNLDKIIEVCKNLLVEKDHYYTNSLGEVKELLTDIIKRWATDRNLKVFVRFEDIELYSNSHVEKYNWMGYIPGLNIGAVAIYNNVGSIEKKSTWLNKIVVARKDQHYYIRNHRARTDLRFISPTDTEFLAFVESVLNYINAGLNV